MHEREGKTEGKKEKRENIDIFKFCMRIADRRVQKYRNEYLKLLPVMYLAIRGTYLALILIRLYFYYSYFCVLNFQSADCKYAWIPPDIVIRKFE